MSPALAGGLLTSEPPGMSFSSIFDKLTMIYLGMVFFAFDSFSFLDLCFCFHNVWNISALFLQTLFFCPNLFLLLLGLQLYMFQAVCLFFFFFNMDYRNLFFLLSSFFLVFFFSSHFIVLSSDSLVLHFLVSIVSSFNGFLNF